MLVRDQPHAIEPAATDGRAHPDIRFVASGPRTTDAVEAVAERDVIARRDAEVVNLAADRPLERLKPPDRERQYQG